MHITECANPKCLTMFRDGLETAGACPKCGHENDCADDGYGDDYLRKVTG